MLFPFSQSHARPFAVLLNEDDAGRFKGPTHLIDAAHPRILSGLEAIDGVRAYAGFGSEVGCGPIERSTRHSALK